MFNYNAIPRPFLSPQQRRCARMAPAECRGACLLSTTRQSIRFELSGRPHAKLHIHGVFAHGSQAATRWRSSLHTMAIKWARLPVHTHYTKTSAASFHDLPPPPRPSLTPAATNLPPDHTPRAPCVNHMHMLSTVLTMQFSSTHASAENQGG
jgi:hypothetical protein